MFHFNKNKTIFSFSKNKLGGYHVIYLVLIKSGPKKCPSSHGFTSSSATYQLYKTDFARVRSCDSEHILKGTVTPEYILKTSHQLR